MPNEEDIVSTRTIGVDLGVTSASDMAVAEGMDVVSTRKVASTPAALTAAFAKLGGHGPVNVVIEATAMAWFVATVAVMRSGIDATLFRVSGTKAAALRKFYRQHTKTDRIDARVLARMPLVDDGLHEFRLPAAGELALKRLVTLRHKLVGESVRVADRIRSTLHWAAPGMLSGRETVTDGFVQILMRWPDLQALARARPSTIAKVGQMSIDRAGRIRDAAVNTVEFYDGLVDFTCLAVEFEVATSQHTTLRAQIARLEHAITVQHEQLHPDDVLLSIPGIGPVVASVIRGCVGNMERFTNLAAFRAYTGLVPRERSSGDSQRRGKISKAGPSMLRWALYLAADVARQSDPELAALYRRLMVERGRHHHQALCAVASHLAGRIWAVSRSNRPYQWRDLDGTPITQQQARAIANGLRLDVATRQRLRQQRGPDVSRSRQPKAPHDHDRPSPLDLTHAALELATALDGT
jgi:transposase